MQVLEDQHERGPACGDLEERPPGCQQRGAIGDFHLAGAHRRGQQLHLPVQRFEARSLKPGADRLPNGVSFRIIRHADQSIQHAAQRPVRQPLTIGEALGDCDLRPRLERG